MGKIKLIPDDVYNRKTSENTHPSGWKNPVPADSYDLVVIGGGAAGLSAAMEGATYGAKTTLIENNFIGGESLTSAGIPSKCLMRSARAAAEVLAAQNLGIRLPQPPEMDFSAVMSRMRAVRARLSPHDSAARLKEMGIDVFFGTAWFTGPDSLEADGVPLRFKRAVVATGSKPSLPAIENPEDVSFFTNESIFSLTQAPQRLAVIGGGSTGCELAQIFQRLGSQVVILQKDSRLLPDEDAEAAMVLQRTFSDENIEMLFGARVFRLGAQGSKKRIDFISHGQENSLLADEILVGSGRIPDTSMLNLESAGVRTGPAGIEVNDQLQTSNPRVYAAGDVCLREHYTHIAEASGRLAAENAVLNYTKNFSDTILSHCIFTDPEIAHAGLSIAEAEAARIPYQVYTQDISLLDRAILEGELAGFVKIVVAQETGKIVGATIVARNAGEMLGTLIASMEAGLNLDRLADAFFPYPTQSEAIQRAALEYRRHRTNSPLPPLPY